VYEYNVPVTMISNIKCGNVVGDLNRVRDVALRGAIVLRPSAMWLPGDENTVKKNLLVKKSVGVGRGSTVYEDVKINGTNFTIAKTKVAGILSVKDSGTVVGTPLKKFFDNNGDFLFKTVENPIAEVSFPFSMFLNSLSKHVKLCFLDR
jgi:hypothetical protein